MKIQKCTPCLGQKKAHSLTQIISILCNKSKNHLSIDSAASNSSYPTTEEDDYDAPELMANKQINTALVQISLINIIHWTFLGIDLSH